MNRARLRPPRRNSGALLRSRLVNALTANVARKLQLVVAPAGFGKTTLLVDVVRATSAVTCWATLDAGDRDLSIFIETLVAAIALRIPEFGERCRAALRDGAGVEHRAQALARLLAADADAQIDQLVVLVLDDFHEVNESTPVTQFLDELLRVLPDTLRIILSSRALPVLTVSRLIVAGDLFGLGEADLRFTTTELLTLLHRRPDLSVDREQARSLAEGAEGWIAGFLLSLPGLWEGLVGGLITARGTEGPLYDYLASEAFDRQTSALQRFLLETSVLETADADLCRGLMGEGDWPLLLDQAERAGLFVTRLPGRGGGFRYHQLFRDFLQVRLRRTAPAEYERLHTVAATLLERRDSGMAALSHLALAGRHDDAAALLRRMLPELEQKNRWRALVDRLAELPAGTLSLHPELALAGARSAVLIGDLARAETWAGSARAAGEASADRGVEAHGLALLGNIRRLQGHTQEALEALDRASHLAPGDQALTAVVQRERGKCLGVQGRFAEAITDFRGALAYFERADAEEEGARTEFGLAVVLAKSGRLSEAIAHYESALTRSRHTGDTIMETDLLNGLGCAYAYQGDYDRARSLLQECLARLQETGDAITEGATLHSLGEVLLAAGEVHAGKTQFQRGLALMQEIGELWVVTHLADALALATAFEGNLAEAEAQAYQALALARRQDSAYLIALCSLTLGAVQTRLGNPEATATLRTAATALLEQGAQREAARAYLWLMQALYATRDIAGAQAYLREALQLMHTLGSDALLDLHLRWNPAPLLTLNGAEAARVAARVERTRVRLAPVPVLRPVDLPEFSARAFGAGELIIDSDITVDWVWGKSRELFFFLLHAGAQRKEQIVDALWPDTPPERGQTALHTAVYRLRRATHPRILRLHGGLYRIDLELVTTYDVREFEQRCSDADPEAAPADAIPLLRGAVALYGAPFLDGLGADWCAAERRRLELRYLTALERLSGRCAAAGLIDESIAMGEALLARDPLREDTAASVIRSHLRLGDRRSARRELERSTAVLRDELGIEPGEELRRLSQQLLA